MATNVDTGAVARGAFDPAPGQSGRESSGSEPTGPDANRQPALGGADTEAEAAGGQADPGTFLYLLRAGLAALGVVLLALSFQLVVLSGLEHKVAQIREFDRFRNDVASGTGPTASTDANGRVLADGTPVALIQIPSIGVKEVVDQGTSGGVLAKGPGYLPTTQFPGEAGVTVIYGRAEAYGGPFGRIGTLHKGAKVMVTTQVGETTYTVLDVRRARQPEPPAPAATEGRLILVTAIEDFYVPSGLLYVDAQAANAVTAAPSAVTAVPASDRPLATDTSNLWELVFWIQGLIVIVLAGVWSWHHWGRTQTWIVGVPLVLLVGYSVAADITGLLPNLM